MLSNTNHNTLLVQWSSGATEMDTCKIMLEEELKNKRNIIQAETSMYLPYSSTTMPSISLIGSSIARSARDGRLSDIDVSSFTMPKSSI